MKVEEKEEEKQEKKEEKPATDGEEVKEITPETEKEKTEGEKVRIKTDTKSLLHGWTDLLQQDFYIISFHKMNFLFSFMP